VWVALRYPRLVGIEAGFGKGGDAVKLPKASVAEFVDWDMQAVYLGKSDLALVESPRDASALLEQPIGVSVIWEQQALYKARCAAAEGSVRAETGLDKDAVRPQHGAVCIYADTSVGRAARMQPSHVVEHETAQWGRTADRIEQNRNIVKRNRPRHPLNAAFRLP
jgi:hypothetical protein